MATYPFTELATITNAQSFGATTGDFRPKVAFRWNGNVYIGQQVINVAPDDQYWINANYPGSERADALYWGYYGRVASLLRCTANGLNIIGASVSGDLGIAAVTASTALTVTWTLKFPNLASGNLTWQWKLLNAADGSVVQSGSLVSPGGGSIALTGLAAGSYLLWVWISTGARAYQWPPPNYVAVTGQTVTPVQYQWFNPTDGNYYYYDPVWNVGALPYDSTKSDQARLLAQRAANIANGTIQKNGAWADYLIIFNDDGTPATFSGEYALLRIVAGGGAWTGDSNVAAAALPGCALQMLVEGSTQNVILHAGLRSVEAWYAEPETGGALWLWGMVAGASGREVCLMRISGTVILASGAGEVTTAVQKCECALSEEAASGIVRFPDDPATGTMYALSYCELFTYQPGATYANRLIGAAPGGRCMIATSNLQGNQTLSYLAENDFAGANKGKNFDYLLTKSGPNLIVGPGVAHHVDSALASFLGALWGIGLTPTGNVLEMNQTPAQQALNTQFLARYDGTEWQQVASWPQSLCDMGRLVASGGKLLIFGQSGAPGSQIPVMMIYDGQSISKTPLSINYFPWRAETVPNAAGTAQDAMMVAQKVVDSVLQAGWVIIEDSVGPNNGTSSSTEPGAGLDVWFVWNATDGAFEVTLSVLEALGISTSTLPAFLIWNGVEWIPSLTAPGSGPYLELEIVGGIVEYVLHGEAPYSFTVWGIIEYESLADIFLRETSAANAEQALALMPDDTVVQVITVRGTVNTILARDAVAASPNTGAIIAGLYPFLWARSDPAIEMAAESPPLGSDQLALLATFDQAIPYNQQCNLNQPAQVECEVVFLIPPDYSIQPMVMPLY